MKATIKLNDIGARKKQQAMRSAVETFAQNIPLDACSFFDTNTSQGVISGQYVGVISGNLRRSLTVERLGPHSAGLGSDLGIAPYASAVRARTAKKYGRDFYRIALKMFRSRAVLAVNAEYARLRGVVASARQYTYRNPFPA
jgi:hypothetical protein